MSEILTVAFTGHAAGFEALNGPRDANGGLQVEWLEEQFHRAEDTLGALVDAFIRLDERDATTAGRG